MKIQPVLSSCEMQMTHIQSPQLRSETLLEMLKAERENAKNNTLNTKTFTSVELSNDMDKNELMYQLNYAIILLTDYQKTQSFSIALPSKAYSKEFADKLNSIKDGIETLVNKLQTE
jgi:hypothetical protein